MTAGSLRAITNKALPCSEVTFLLDGREVVVTGFDVLYPRKPDAKGEVKPTGKPTLVIRLREES